MTAHATPASTPSAVPGAVDAAHERYPVAIDQYTAYRRDGFVIMRGVLSDADVVELREHTEQMMDGNLPEQRDLPAFDPDAVGEEEAVFAGRDNRYQTTKTVRELVRPPAHLPREKKAELFLRIHMLHRKLELHERYLLHPRVLDILEVLVGPDVLALQSMLFLKGPGKPGQGWHQDSYYIPTLPDTLIGAWLAIDDADEYNGGLWLAKGSGHEPIYPPCPELGYGFGDRMVKGITHIQHPSDPNDDINTLTNVARGYDHVLGTVKAGDVVFFNGHVLHRSKRNITEDRFRRAFVGHYCNARSFTPWARDMENPTGFDEATGAANGSHILARGDTHLGYAPPKFGTPCAALVPKAERAARVKEVVRQIAQLDNGLMGCGITHLDTLRHDDHDSTKDVNGY